MIEPDHSKASCEVESKTVWITLRYSRSAESKPITHYFCNSSFSTISSIFRLWFSFKPYECEISQKSKSFCNPGKNGANKRSRYIPRLLNGFFLRNVFIQNIQRLPFRTHTMKESVFCIVHQCFGAPNM